MTNFNLYRVFYYVAKHKNLTKASEVLYISQPAVSSSIKELENQIGETLFERKNKGVELTTFGALLFENIKSEIQNLEKLENLGQRYKDLNFGILRIGCSSSNLNQIVGQYLKSFAQSHPKIKIIMKRANENELKSMLEENQLDVIFINQSPFQKNFVCVKEYDIKYNIIGNIDMRNKYPEDEISLDDFPECDLILPSKNNNSRKFIDEFFEQQNKSLSSKYELDNYIMLFDFVKNGLGIAFVNTEFYKKNIEDKEVFILFPKLQLPTRKMHCLISKRNQNPTLEDFVNIIKLGDKLH